MLAAVDRPAAAGVARARGVLTVPVAGDAALPRWCAGWTRRASRVTELALRLPSLDEVFLALTGHRADDEEEAA